MINHRRPIVAILGLAVIVAACGGGSSAAPSSGGSAGASQPAASTAASVEPGASSGGGGGGGSDIPDIAEGPWGAGTAKVEITGGVSVTVDGTMPEALGYTLEGLTVFVFSDASASGVINITLSNDEATGFGVSTATPMMTTAGTWGVDGCEIDISKNDDSGIEATFGCDGIPALSGGTTAQTIDLSGEFSVAR